MLVQKALASSLNPTTGHRRLRRAVRTVLALALAACSPSEPGSAPPDVIDGSPSCPDCEIAFRPVALLGSDDDPGSAWDGAAGDGCMLAQLSTGEFLLGGIAGGDDIFVYDAGGQFVRAMSRQGQGPGELQGMARIWVGPGDTLFVADDGNTRLQVLSSRRGGLNPQVARVVVVHGPQDGQRLAIGPLARFSSTRAISSGEWSPPSGNIVATTPATVASRWASVAGWTATSRLTERGKEPSSSAIRIACSSSPARAKRPSNTANTGPLANK